MLGYYTSDYSKSNLLKNANISFVPPLTCTYDDTIDDLTYSIRQYKTEALPTWVSISAIGNVSGTTPGIKTDTLYYFYIDSVSLSGTTISTKVTLQVLGWDVENCLYWKPESNSIWVQCISGFQTYNYGTEWLTVVLSGSVQATKSSSQGAAGAVTTVSMVSSMMTFSSPQAIWTMANVYQLLMILPLTRIYMPKDVIDFITGMKISTFNFKFIPTQHIPFVNSVLDNLDFAQSDEYLGRIGLESGSSIVNNISTFGMWGLSVVIHLCILAWLRKCKWEKYAKLRNFKTKIKNFLAFTYYVRSVLESFIILSISNTAEVLNLAKSTNTGSMICSIVIHIFLVTFLVHMLIYWLISRKSDQPQTYFEEYYAGVKPKFLAKSYLLVNTTKKILLITLAIYFNGYDEFIKTLIMAAIQGIYTLYLCIVRPFQKACNNIIEILSEMIYLAICILLVNCNKSSNWNQAGISVFLNLISVNTIGVTFIIMIATGLECRQKICKRKRKVQQVEEEKANEEFPAKPDHSGSVMETEIPSHIPRSENYESRRDNEGIWIDWFRPHIKNSKKVPNSSVRNDTSSVISNRNIMDFINSKNNSSGV